MCDDLEWRAGCLLPQPRSAVLQWVRSAAAFQELSTATATAAAAAAAAANAPACAPPPDFGGDLPIGDMTEAGLAADRALGGHQFALRVDAGRAFGWEHMRVGTAEALVYFSSTRGAVALSWPVARVAGVAAASALALGPALEADGGGTELLMVSAAGRSVARLLLDSAVYDGLGRSVTGGIR